MITVGTRNKLAAEVVHLMHEFRHEVFVRRLGWRLPLVEGVERDKYDNENAVYFLVRDQSDNITACARLLPTTLPYVLSELFPELLGDVPAPNDPGVWELSRFAASVRKSGEGRVLSLSQPTLDLLEAILDFGRRNGATRLLLVTAVGIERLLLRSGFEVHRLAPPTRTEEGLVVALFIEVTGASQTRDAGTTDTRAHTERALETH